jgi:hypothetical protein
MSLLGRSPGKRKRSIPREDLWRRGEDPRSQDVDKSITQNQGGRPGIKENLLEAVSMRKPREW